MALSSRFSRIRRLGQSLTTGGLTMCLMLAAPAFSSPQRQPATAQPITIRIYDYAQSTPSVRRHAEEAAGNILREAGVATRWIDCPVNSATTRDCSGPGSPLDFVIDLLPYSMSEPLHLGTGSLGFSTEASGKDFASLACVFYDAAKARAAEYHQDPGELLGDVIAHELGHLLLGTDSHSGWGLMSPLWSSDQFRRASQGLLAFSNSESERIQAALSARALAAATREEVSKSSRVAPSGETFNARVQQSGVSSR